MPAANSAKPDPLGGWSKLPADQVPLDFSSHCVWRFETRAHHGRDMPSSQVRREMARMLAGAVVTREPPGWLPEQEDPAVAYLVIADSFCMPLRWGYRRDDLLATTAISRGTLSSGTRERRNLRRARSNEGRRAARVAVRGRRDPVPPPEAMEWDE